ncbi:MAG: CtsR family transcriptional regulator [Clostridia bacterium]|nr:CtsR family transcriptional regulator [Clostridia bacterium]
MGLSDRIEAFISELLRDDNDFAEFGRNELANIFGCVPSQINYVISTRFNEKNGYLVESRRGGGGYIRITRAGFSGLDEEIGKECDFKRAEKLINQLLDIHKISPHLARVILAAVNEESLENVPKADELRARILKNTISVL